MKKIIFTLSFLICVSQILSQNIFFNMLKGENGISKQLIQIPTQYQIAFNPQNARNILGLDAQSDLKLYSTEKDDLGYVHYRYYQTYAGIPIENSMLIAHVKNGKLVSISACIVTNFNNSMKQKSSFITIKDKEAIQKVISYVGAKVYVWQDKEMEDLYKEQMENTSATYYPQAVKVWYNSGGNINPKDLQLAYKIDVFAEDPYSRAYYFVDAVTGKVLGRKESITDLDVIGSAQTLYSDYQIIHSNQVDINTFLLRDYSRGKGVFTLHGEKDKNGQDYINTYSSWTFNLPDINALDAHWGVEMTYDFYQIKFKRNSIDNKGLRLISLINKAGIKNNANWDGKFMNYGTFSDGSQKGVTSIDVTGHELTHGVTQYTCSLNTEGESGAINESISDIMGKSVQFSAKPYDTSWIIGNDMGIALRDMSNTKDVAQPQPNTYKATEQYWKNTEGCIPSIENDNCWVHNNSGVGNFMFYLLVNGGSGTNDLGNAYNVQGIGLGKADLIIYRSQTVYLVPISNYPNWRTDCIAAATDLYGANSNEVQQVKNAFYAVGIDETLQTPYIYSNCFGGSSQEMFKSISKTYDGYFICAGNTRSIDGDVTGYHTGGYWPDGWVVKFGKNGNIEWERCYGGTLSEKIFNIKQTFDSGYVFCGSSSSNDGDVSCGIGSYPWIVKLDRNGNIQWQTCLGNASCGGCEFIDGMVQSRDSGYLVVSSERNSNVSKLDKNGKMQWQTNLDSLGYFYSCIATKDGNYVLVGETGNILGGTHYGLSDIIVVKINAKGKVIWKKYYGGSDYDYGTDILQSPDGGYIFSATIESKDGDVIGSHSGGDAWIVKIDKSGNIQWQKCIGGSNGALANSVSLSNDNQYLISGGTGSNDGDFNGFHGGEDAFVAQLDKSGNLQWVKSFGGTRNEEFEALVQLSDNSIIATGFTGSIDGDVIDNHNHDGGNDAWNVKLIPDSTSNSLFVSSIITNALLQKEVRIYPNPASQYIIIDLGFPVVSYTYSITDVAGRTFIKQSTSNSKIPVNNLPTGVYILNVVTENYKVYFKKFVKL